jgi:hypothetical protein
MIIWSGYGFVVVVIVFLSSLFSEIISEDFTKNENYYQENFIPLGCSFIVSALLIKLFSNFMISRKMRKNVANDRSNYSVSEHKLFFISIHYWSLIMLVLGVSVIIYQLFS